METLKKYMMAAMNVEVPIQLVPLQKACIVTLSEVVRKIYTFSMLGIFACFFCHYLIFFSESTLIKIRKATRVSNSWYSDQASRL